MLSDVSSSLKWQIAHSGLLHRDKYAMTVLDKDEQGDFTFGSGILSFPRRVTDPEQTSTPHLGSVVVGSWFRNKRNTRARRLAGYVPVFFFWLP